MITNTRNSVQWILILAMAMIATLFIYSFGFPGSWTFDDTRYLRHLADVQDLSDALVYLFRDKGISTTDRPLAMASFLLNVDDWPDDRAGFLWINVFLHILNGLLVALVAKQISMSIPRLTAHGTGFAVSLAALWMLHPFLASTSFHVIQRMVLLAAAFSLTGIAMYVHGRGRLIKGFRDGYVWMSAGLLIGTCLGTLAKENAFLTPLLVAVLEFTVLNHFSPCKDQSFRRWQLLFFAMPTLFLVAYLSYYVIAVAPHVYVIRPFSLAQRLYSEGVILFEYLRQLFLPDVTMMGPFQDDTWRIRGAGPVTLFALAGWLLLIVAAVVTRRRFPALSFAVLFFLAGHMLESTVLSLELYFEHRNYLPSLGPLGAAVALAWSSPAVWPRILVAGFTVAMAYLLWITTSVWGDPEHAAIAWSEAHPSSTRATQNLATQYQVKGDFDAAAATIIKGHLNNPLDGALAANALISTCFDTPTTRKHRPLLEQIAGDASRMHYSPMVVKTVHRMVNLFDQNQCASFDTDRFIAVLSGFLKNPSYNRPVVQYGLMMAVSRALKAKGMDTEATETKMHAFRTWPVIDTAHAIVRELMDQKKTREARRFLNDARRLMPQYKARYDDWERMLPGD